MSSWHLDAQVVEPVVGSSPLSRAYCDCLQASVPAEVWKIGSGNPSESPATTVLFCSSKGGFTQVSLLLPAICQTGIYFRGRSGRSADARTIVADRFSASGGGRKKIINSLCASLDKSFFPFSAPRLDSWAECVSCAGS